MDENIVKFQEKLRELVSLGKKKKGILEIQEINDFFSDMELDSDQMEKVFDYLEANNVDVLRISNDDDDIPDEIVMSDEDDIDVEKIDLSVPDGISIEDPVRITQALRLRALAGFFGRVFMVRNSVPVRMMLFSNFGSTKGAISFGQPQRADPYSSSRRNFLAFLLFT